MKRIATAAAVCLAVTAASVSAQSLQPQMSAQDIRANLDPEPGHLLVPIMMMVFLVAVATGGGSNATVAASDARVKTDIVPVGRTAHGLTLHEFRYLGMPDVWRGVMAQDVAQVMPAAVQRHPTGYLMVDYAMLGIAMERVR